MAATADSMESKPLVCLVVGMAGSGKTTLMQRLNAHVHQHSIPSYLLNLDPAVRELPYDANIDIRDTVDYKQVMKQYELGPNGGILTSLNLFATRFNQVMDIVEKRKLRYVFVDTPGQIEVFAWSASGQIITESLASGFPTMVLYVVDTPRCQSPITFMSNMTYACSILYKTQLPFMLVFNKTDVVSHEFATNWMQNSESFEDALSTEKSYMATLTRSMCFVMEEFYKNIQSVGVSSFTGEGMEELFSRFDVARKEYFDEFLPVLQRKTEEKLQKQKEAQQSHLRTLQKETELNDGETVVLGSDTADADPSEQMQTKEQVEEYQQYQQFLETLIDGQNTAIGDSAQTEQSNSKQ